MRVLKPVEVLSLRIEQATDDALRDGAETARLVDEPLLGEALERVEPKVGLAQARVVEARVGRSGTRRARCGWDVRLAEGGEPVLLCKLVRVVLAERGDDVGLCVLILVALEKSEVFLADRPREGLGVGEKGCEQQLARRRLCLREVVGDLGLRQRQRRQRLGHRRSDGDERARRKWEPEVDVRSERRRRGEDRRLTSRGKTNCRRLWGAMADRAGGRATAGQGRDGTGSR